MILDQLETVVKRTVYPKMNVIIYSPASCFKSV